MRAALLVLNYTLPSPSLGPPLLSASWSPPLPCGIDPLDGGVGAGVLVVVVVGGGGLGAAVVGCATVAGVLRAAVVVGAGLPVDAVV